MPLELCDAKTKSPGNKRVKRKSEVNHKKTNAKVTELLDGKNDNMMDCEQLKRKTAGMSGIVAYWAYTTAENAETSTHFFCSLPT